MVNKQSQISIYLMITPYGYILYVLQQIKKVGKNYMLEVIFGSTGYIFNKLR